jgi:hypothetical protein
MTRQLEESVGELRSKYAETVMTMWGFWVPFMCLNFRVVPPHLNVIAMQAANLAWTVVISHIGHR